MIEILGKEQFTHMNEIWNLDPIYKGFDDPAFEADMASLKALT